MKLRWSLLIAPLLAVLTACPPTSPPTITSFTATPTSLTAPGSVTLTWNTVNASSLSISPGVGAVTGNSKSVNVTSSTTFTLTASNTSGSVTATASVTVGSSPPPPPSAPVIASFTATPSSLPAGGGSTTLAWNVTGATGLSVDGGVGDVTGQTSKAVNVTSTKTFKLTATNASSSSTATVDVTVGVSSLQPGVWDQSNWNEATWQ